MKKIKLEIIGLSNSQAQSGAYALILGETDGKRRLPIIIGGYEAQAIAVELENMQPSRPLTHDLFKNFSDEYGIKIDEVIVYNLKEGIFYAKLICNNKNGDVREIDARTSDAIAMAVRFNCPIYTYEFILASAGIVIEGNEFVFLENIEPQTEEKVASSTLNYSSLSEEELKTKLKDALADEAYEKAANIRDELSRRKSS